MAKVAKADNQDCGEEPWGGASDRQVRGSSLSGLSDGLSCAPVGSRQQSPGVKKLAVNMRTGKGRGSSQAEVVQMVSSLTQSLPCRMRMKGCHGYEPQPKFTGSLLFP